MQKDFDLWNNKKKELNSYVFNDYVHYKIETPLVAGNLGGRTPICDYKIANLIFMSMFLGKGTKID